MVKITQLKNIDELDLCYACHDTVMKEAIKHIREYQKQIELIKEVNPKCGSINYIKGKIRSLTMLFNIPVDEL